MRQTSDRAAFQHWKAGHPVPVRMCAFPWLDMLLTAIRPADRPTRQVTPDPDISAAEVVEVVDRYPGPVPPEPWPVPGPRG